jgi:hypothetical protein
MKFSTLTLSFILFLVACNSTIPLSTTPSISELDDSMKIFKSIISGSWAEQAYLDDLVKTKSPVQSQDSLTEIVELETDTSGIKSDSLEVGAVGIHEGGYDFVVYFRPGITPTSLPTNIKDEEIEMGFYELGYELTNEDTSLIIYHYNKNKKLLDQTRYIKVPRNTEGALQYMVNKILFSGNYKAIDSTGEATNIQFSNDGIVTGLPNFKKYYVLTDFVAGPENRVDEVCFDIQTPNQTCYAYQIKADTISLFEEAEKESDTLIVGQLKYKLVRQ